MQEVSYHMKLKMVLFKNNECNTRFPTWHPDFPCPIPKLKVSSQCPIDVHPDDWDTKPTGESDLATFHTGRCLRCRKAFLKEPDDPMLAGVTPFGTANNMNLVAGMDDSNLLPESRALLPMDPIFGHDEQRVRAEFKYLFENATVSYLCTYQFML